MVIIYLGDKMGFKVARIRKWMHNHDKNKRTPKVERYGVYVSLEQRFRRGGRVVSKHIRMLPELSVGVIKNGIELARKERRRLQRQITGEKR